VYFQISANTRIFGSNSVFDVRIDERSVGSNVIVLEDAIEKGRRNFAKQIEITFCHLICDS
jgi:hypothetical protein